MTEKQAEDFVKEYREAFLDGVGLMMDRPKNNVTGFNAKGEEYIKRVDPAHIEGQDFVSLPVLGNIGSLEVKANSQFLTQDNNDTMRTGLEPAGTLYFEVFQDWKPDRRNEMYQGWMYSIIDPETYTDIKAEWRIYWTRRGKNLPEVTAERWGNFAVVLLDGREEPFACVAFQNIGALIDRLRALCPDAEGWGLYNIRQQRPATDKNYWDRYTKYYDTVNHSYHNIKWNGTYGGILGTDWHIPLRSLADIDGVKITIIGNDRNPAEEYRLAVEQREKEHKKYYGSEKLIAQRLNALKELATTRVNPEQLKAKRDEIFIKTGKKVHGITDAQIEELIKRYGGKELTGVEE